MKLTVIFVRGVAVSLIFNIIHCHPVFAPETKLFSTFLSIHFLLRLLVSVCMFSFLFFMSHFFHIR